MITLNNFRGTKIFLVSVATEADPDNWIPVVRDRLENVAGIYCEEQPGKRTFEFAATRARYAKFEALSYYGDYHAALQFFDIY